MQSSASVGEMPTTNDTVLANPRYGRRIVREDRQLYKHLSALSVEMSSILRLEVPISSTENDVFLAFTPECVPAVLSCKPRQDSSDDATF